MDRDTLKEILKNIGKKCGEELGELSSSYKVSVIELLRLEYYLWCQEWWIVNINKYNNFFT